MVRPARLLDAAAGGRGCGACLRQQGDRGHDARGKNHLRRNAARGGAGEDRAGADDDELRQHGGAGSSAGSRMCSAERKRRGLWLAALAVAAVAASALLIAWQSGTDEKTKDADVWPTMEDYALDRANAVRESGVALFPQPPGGAAVAAVSDVRATELERAAVLDGVFPELDGRPELWCYDYAVRFADEESLSLADQGRLVQHRRWLVRQQAVRCARCACERGRLSHSVHRNMRGW